MELEDLGRAVAFAARHHRDGDRPQMRKGTQIPYVSHLLAVAGLVLEHGGNATQAVAGVLHDTLEDCPDVDRAMLSATFCEDVAAIVEACTDTLPDSPVRDASTWRARKQRAVAHIRAAADEQWVLVAACDKLHNLSTIVADVRAEGPGTLRRFNAPAEDLVWYYGAIAEALDAAPLPPSLAAGYRRLYEEFAGSVRPHQANTSSPTP